MEKAMYPSPYMRITQKDHTGTHAHSWAVDEAGSDGGIDYLVAPFTGKIKKIYKADANEVWLESCDPVEYPDGTIDYMTVLFAHDNDVSNLYEGQIIKQGQRFYEEGTKGNATGNHCHIECGLGKFTGTGWYKNPAGYYTINNSKLITECLFIDDTYHIMNTKGYSFKHIKDAFSNKKNNDSKLYVTLADMYVRNSPEVRDDNHKLVKDLTTDGKKNATSSNEDDWALYKKGTVFTARRLINNSDGSVWAESPSGYICIKDNEQIYCSKKA